MFDLFIVMISMFIAAVLYSGLNMIVSLLKDIKRNQETIIKRLENNPD